MNRVFDSGRKDAQRGFGPKTRHRNGREAAILSSQGFLQFFLREHPFLSCSALRGPVISYETSSRRAKGKTPHFCKRGGRGDFMDVVKIPLDPPFPKWDFDDPTGMSFMKFLLLDWTGRFGQRRRL